MSRTVSFRASEELDEFLEQEAERRMTTKSTAAQMLLAERVRQLQGDDDGDDETDQSDSGASHQSDSGLPEVFERHKSKWYRPESQKNNFAVRLPEDRGTKYYKTQDGAASRLRKEFDE